MKEITEASASVGLLLATALCCVGLKARNKTFCHFLNSPRALASNKCYSSTKTNTSNSNLTGIEKKTAEAEVASSLNSVILIIYFSLCNLFCILVTSFRNILICISRKEQKN